MNREDTICKLEWLENLFRDTRLSPLAVRVAGLIATRYLNNGSKTAFMAVATLAEDLGVDRRSIQRAIAELVELGVIKRKLGGGRERANVYTIPGLALNGGASAAVSDPKQRRFSRETAALAPPEPLDEPLAGVRSGRADGPRMNGATAAPTPIPEDLRFSAKEAELALGSSARWEPDRALSEFERFKTYYRNPGRLKIIETEADWRGRRWKDWCEKGAGFDERDAQKAQASAARPYRNRSDAHNDRIRYAFDPFQAAQRRAAEED